jgi:hypothetical protein
MSSFNAVLQCERVKVLSAHGMTSRSGSGGAELLSTSALNEGKWSATRSGRFTQMVRDPGTRGIGDCVVSRSGMDVVFNDDFSLKVMANLNKNSCFC